MRHKTIEISADRVEREFLPWVTRPGRYIGGEINQVRKDLNACELRIALCFPDVYEVGMSNSGLAILYHILNGLEGVAAGGGRAGGNPPRPSLPAGAWPTAASRWRPSSICLSSARPSSL